METFELSLSDGGKIAGLLFIPETQIQSPAKAKPLVVAFYGGSYSSKYYNLDPEHSIVNISGSSPLPYPRQNDTSIQQQARYMHNLVLPAVWQRYGGAISNTTSVAIQGHSIGGAMSITIAGLHGRDENPKYPLTSLTTSGVGSQLVEAWKGALEETRAQGMPRPAADGTLPKPSSFSPARKDHIMINQDMHLASEAVYASHHTLNFPLPAIERYDIYITWYEWWRTYAESVKVPLFTTISEYDRLAVPSEEHLTEFKAGFSSCPRMETLFLPEAPHCIELSHMGQAWLAKAFGFALQGAVAEQFAKGRESKM